MGRRSLAASLFGIILVAIVALGATVLAGRSPLLGIDLKGGVEVVEAPQGHFTNGDLNQAVDIIDRRINGLGVANSSVERQGNDVVIELPGIRNSQGALTTIGSTGQLYFRPVYCVVAAQAKAGTKAKASTGTKTKSTKKHTTARNPSKSASSTTSTSLGAAAAPGRTGVLTAKMTPTSTGSTTTSVPKRSTTSTTTPSTTTPSTTSPTTVAKGSATKTKTTAAGLTESDCSQPSKLAAVATTGADQDNPDKAVILAAAPDDKLPDGDRYLLGRSTNQAGIKEALSGTIVKSASAQYNSSNGEYSVEVTLTSSGLTKFNKVAAVRNATYSASDPPFSSEEAIELDGQVESAPAIENPTFTGQVQITGDFTSKQASDLALELNYGSLPVRFKAENIDTVSATIGSASLRAGLLAGLGGIILVLLYMVVYYRALGLVVVLGLGVGGALLYSILTELSYTSNLALTLEGVTGIIVSIGITVDSYVVYFERLKDEIRSGKTIRASVERGFKLAFKTVLTADLVSFMAALILYLFTIGDVRGFAFTLGLSTLLDVFTAYFFIRPIVILLGRRRSATDGKLLGMARGLGAAGGTR